MGNPPCSGHPYKASSHSVLLWHRSLTASWPALTSKSTINRPKKVILSLYSALRRSHLESCIWVWASSVEMQYQELGGSQWRVITVVGGPEHTGTQCQGAGFCLASWEDSVRQTTAAVQQKKNRSSEKLSCCSILGQGESCSLCHHLTSSVSGEKTVEDLDLFYYYQEELLL